MKIALRPERDQFLVRARSTAPTGHTAGICHHRPPRAALERRFALSAPPTRVVRALHQRSVFRTDDEIDEKLKNDPKFKLPGVNSRLLRADQIATVLQALSVALRIFKERSL